MSQHATSDAHPPQRRVEGEVQQFRIPEWRPLLEIVGDLSGEFMWMCELTLEDGTTLHAYKHRATRRYFHLSLAGDAFVYAPIGECDCYRSISRYDALVGVFERWHEITCGLRDYDEMCAALEQAFDHARNGTRFPLDPQWLERQRRYEEAVQLAAAEERRDDPRYRGAEANLPGDNFVGDLDELESMI